MTVLDRARLDAGVATVKSIVRGDDHTQVEINEILVNRAKDELKLAQQRFENGDCSQLDVRAAEARLERAEGDLALSRGLKRGDAEKETEYEVLLYNRKTSIGQKKVVKAASEAEARRKVAVPAGYEISDVLKLDGEGDPDYADVPPATYNREAVQKAIEASTRAGQKISGREAKLIHALLRGRRDAYDDAEDPNWRKIGADPEAHSIEDLEDAIIALGKLRGGSSSIAVVAGRAGKRINSALERKRADAAAGDRKAMSGGGEAVHGRGDADKKARTVQVQESDGEWFVQIIWQDGSITDDSVYRKEDRALARGAALVKKHGGELSA